MIALEQHYDPDETLTLSQGSSDGAVVDEQLQGIGKYGTTSYIGMTRGKNGGQ